MKILHPAQHQEGSDYHILLGSLASGTIKDSETIREIGKEIGNVLDGIQADQRVIELIKELVPDVIGPVN